MCQKTIIINSCLGCERVLVSAIWGLKRRSSHKEAKSTAFVFSGMGIEIKTSDTKLHPEKITVSVERYCLSLGT